MSINDRFSDGGNSPKLADRYADYGKSQLQEMLYLEDNQLEQVTPGMTVKEIRKIRTPDPAMIEGDEPVSVLGYPAIVRPEGSLLSTPGCGRDYCYSYCFSCHYEGCEIRQVDCYCVEAPMGNPFPCKTLDIVDRLKETVKNDCQFVNKDLAFHRVGDGQPVPCCKKCPNPCEYECERANLSRKKAKDEKAQKEKVCDVAHDESIEEKHGTSIDALDLSVRTYNVLKRAGLETIEELQSMSDVDLATIRNFSKRCMDEVHSKFEEYVRNNSENPLCDVAQDESYGIDNGEYSVVIEQPENEINQPESVIEDDETVIDVEYTELDKEVDEESINESQNLNDLTFTELAIGDYLEDEERTLTEYEECNKQEKGFPQRLLQKQQMLVKALRLLMEHEADHEDDDDVEEQEEIEPVQPELPVLKNNDQRKEWLNDYKSWGLWYRDENIDVNYYKYDFSDGSRLVVAEYPQRRMYRKANEFRDEHYYHLLDKNRKFYGTDKTFEQKYVHSTDSETSLVEFLKNLQKGDKK